MGNCKFANELNRLCKSSSDSIDNTEKFDDFKKYMHVTRTAEEDLKAILRNVNAGNKNPLSGSPTIQSLSTVPILFSSFLYPSPGLLKATGHIEHMIYSNISSDSSNLLLSVVFVITS